MRAVLYATDFEPITIIDLPPTVLHYIAVHQQVNLAVMEPVKFESPDDEHEPLKIRHVNIRAERIKRGEHEAWMLFTADEESALLLKAAFLPGQVGELRSREREAFIAGVATAFKNLLR